MRTRVPTTAACALTRFVRGWRGVLVALLAVAALATAHAPGVITVRSGDTLWDLARAHGTSVQQLQALNGLGGSGVIYAGQTLKIPGSGTSSPSTPSGSTYTVRPGDTVSHLAARFGVSTRAIVQANGLASSGLIRIGQRLTIPGRGASTSGSTVPRNVSSSVGENRARLARGPQPSRTEVQNLIAATAREYGVPVSLALAVAYQESGFQQHVVSPVNAIGVMQVLPRTGRGLSQQMGRELNLFDVRDNVTAGVYLLRQLLRATGSTDGALAGYYQGLGSIAKKGRLPQTEAYIRNVRALQARFGG